MDSNRISETTPLIAGGQVMQMIPQRPPFVMVDVMYTFSDTSLESGFTIQNNNIFLSNNCFLEAGIIEHMAQSVALHTGYSFFLKQEPAPTGYIGSIKDIEIKQLPLLGEEIRTMVTILHQFAGVTLVDVVTRCNGAEIASGQMKTVLAKQ